MMILILTNFVKSKPHFPFDSRCPNRCEISHYRILQPDPINNLNPIPQKGRKVKSRGHKHNNGSHCRIFLHEFQCQPAVTGGLVIAENVRKKIRFFLLVFILKNLLQFFSIFLHGIPHFTTSKNIFKNRISNLIKIWLLFIAVRLLFYPFLKH